jgi:hypothetical protein
MTRTESHFQQMGTDPWRRSYYTWEINKSTATVSLMTLQKSQWAPAARELYNAVLYMRVRKIAKSYY